MKATHDTRRLVMARVGLMLFLAGCLLLMLSLCSPDVLFLAGGVICNVGALGLGIAGWRHRSGKIAVIGAAVSLILLVGFLVFAEASGWRFRFW